MKKILTILLAVFCLVALPVSAHAAKEKELSKEQQVIRKARRIYSASLAGSGKSSFHGYCGLMTSRQIYHMGINKWCVVNDGNDQFDYYAGMDKTTGGYYVTTYYLEDYSMEEALDQLSREGTKDVYNILVGFQWTSTEAGAKYGHAVFINAILDGIVYFMEGFDSAAIGVEGTVGQLTIDEFVAYYANWTTYEGMVHFGGFMDTCTDYSADVILRSRFATGVRSLPALVGQEDCAVLRQVAAGELLHADALIQTAGGEWFYRVEGGYISANAVLATQVCGDSMTLTDFAMAEAMEENEDPQLSGVVTGGEITAVSASVIDVWGDVVLRERVETSALSELNEHLSFDLLVPGWYWVEITGEATSTVLTEGAPRQEYARRVLHRAKLQVGKVGEDTLTAASEKKPNGWSHEAGKWYYYRDGAACNGWLTDRGVRYFLDESGAALTGKQEIGGKKYRFTDTGAMITGWVTTGEGVYYLDEQGVMATGTVTIGDSEYTFDENGILQ